MTPSKAFHTEKRELSFFTIQSFISTKEDAYNCTRDHKSAYAFLETQITKDIISWCLYIKPTVKKDLLRKHYQLYNYRRFCWCKSCAWL